MRWLCKQNSRTFTGRYPVKCLTVVLHDSVFKRTNRQPAHAIHARAYVPAGMVLEIGTLKTEEHTSQPLILYMQDVAEKNALMKMMKLENNSL